MVRFPKMKYDTHLNFNIFKQNYNNNLPREMGYIKQRHIQFKTKVYTSESLDLVRKKIMKFILTNHSNLFPYDPF